MSVSPAERDLAAELDAHTSPIPGRTSTGARMNGAICGDELRETVRRPDGPERWCFHCRTKRRFDYVVLAPVGISYYGPTPSIECATCHTPDGDRFPGYQREWEEDG